MPAAVRIGAGMVASSRSFVAESVEFACEAANIDRVRGIITAVRVCNPRSRNGRKYPLTVLEKHLALYAAEVNVGHHRHPVTGAPVEVPPYDKFGRIQNPRIHTGGIVGDLKYNPEHAFAKPFLWAAENDQQQFCFSPFKQVRWHADTDADGDRVAESILSVASVDIVGAGGTTAGIFESFVPDTWAAEMVDAEKVAAGLESDGAWVAFLTDLFAKMKNLSQTTKDTISALVASAMAGSTDAAVPADGADMAAAGPAMESLRRMGPVGKWAAKQLDAVFVAESAKKRETWAAQLIKAEQVPDALVSPVFVSMVAESYGNDARAKELIADRKKLGTGRREPQHSDRKGLPSVKDLVDGYTTG